MPTRSATERVYRGIPPAQRAAERREQLIEAAIEVFGTRGFLDSSVRGICQEAGLNQRYFYESFADREELLAAVYERIVAEAVAATVAAVDGAEDAVGKVRGGQDAWWRSITDDPRRARILAREVTGVSDKLERRRREHRQSFAGFIEQQFAENAGDHMQMPPDMPLVARSLIAATLDPLADLTLGDGGPTVEQLVDYCTGMFLETIASIGRANRNGVGRWPAA